MYIVFDSRMHNTEKNIDRKICGITSKLDKE